MIMSKEYKPEKLSFHIGGHSGTSYSVEWEKKGLIYQADYEEDILRPSQEEWIKFWQEIDELNVWDWEEKYLPEEKIMDGTSWSINLKYREKSVESSGSNAYPNKFSQFCDLVEELCEGRKFK
jgi:hypothetical protein